MRAGLSKKLKGGTFIPNVELARENTRMRLSVGGMADLKYIQLFAGIGRKSEDNFYSAGFAVSWYHFYFDLGARSRNAIAGNGSKEVALASSLRFGF